ncbi:hypothetical protein [Paraburkholderia hospita]|uniref:Uncharacterized protein n=1 Tax=Paraburkholderia hospita TaxID=169430 RepID=A0AAJ5BAR7_9BURK|nr:hypothetical protein [Paraburkholderia hospita]AUT73271.1 hypothetical protein C2L64_33290 [Paraburkholderia hospita]AXF04900.1 hypothetical protein CUJ88_41845 [Paraburkholderia hospita]EIN01113.1 hypothetical protein WQE_10626 [Paraburkholderia hospita]OUL68967.1 hypothetical protein CA601_50530 [Paraburkholderia hospita]OUL88705.1 hypothetical protein CA602_10685 [Paraburkholderia hospita]
MRHLPDLQRPCISDSSQAQLLALLHSDVLTRESLALLPTVLLIAWLQVHTHVGWDACFAIVRQLNNDHGRHMRELSTALSLLRSLRGTRILDPLAWHAAARRIVHAITNELRALHSMPRRAACVRVARGGLSGRNRVTFTLRRSGQLLELSRYWLAARASAPLTWL